MRVIPIRSRKNVYSGNVYLILGNWSCLEDINSLVDTGGTDGGILDEIGKIYTGVGKKPVERVILTHEHFDHSGGLTAVKQKYDPEVYAFMDIDGTNKLLRDGQVIKLGDRDFEVMHTQGHSQNSICLYCAQERVLFSGDTSLDIKTPEGSYAEEFVNVLEKIVRLDIDIIYPGHGSPVTKNAQEMIRNTLINVKKSHIKKA
jgi:glyoxylase-like metal-dependent hydrolase (beta-lactamase superfamily II)